MKISTVFEWYNFWVGIYYDKKKRTLYFLPVPMIGLKIQFGTREGFLPDLKF